MEFASPHGQQREAEALRKEATAQRHVKALAKEAERTLTTHGRIRDEDRLTELFHLNREDLVREAASNGHINLLRLLHSARTPLNRPDYAANLPAEYAVVNGQTEVLDFLAKEVEGMELEQLEKNGRSLAVTAAEAGRVDVLRYLADNGADLSRSRLMGDNPATAAVRRGQTQVLKFLRSKLGRKVNKRDAAGATPWRAAKALNRQDLQKIVSWSRS